MTFVFGKRHFMLEIGSGTTTLGASHVTRLSGNGAILDHTW